MAALYLSIHLMIIWSSVMIVIKLTQKYKIIINCKGVVSNFVR